MSEPDHQVCAQCIQNEDLWVELFRGAEAGKCDFDSRHGDRYPVIPIEEAAITFDEAFQNTYCPSQSVRWLGDSDAHSRSNGEPLHTCVQDFMLCDEKVADALIEHAPDEGVWDGEPPFYDASCDYERIADVYAREQAEADDWLDWIHREPHPFHSFQMDVRDTRMRLQAMADNDPFLCRLLFIHQIGALERYLHEIFRKLIDANANAKLKFVLSTEKLNGKSIKLSEIMRDADFVDRKITAYLHSVSFHHLPMVDGMFQKAFGFSIFPHAEDDVECFKHIIALRHDCIHRNGRKKETGELNVIFRNDLSDHTANIERLGSHVHVQAQAFLGQQLDETTETNTMIRAGEVD